MQADRLDRWQQFLGDLRVVLINAPAGDWAAGDRGFAALPGREAQFRDTTLRGLDLDVVRAYAACGTKTAQLRALLQCVEQAR